MFIMHVYMHVRARSNLNTKRFETWSTELVMAISKSALDQDIQFEGQKVTLCNSPS